MGFCPKTGLSLSFPHVQLTKKQSAQKVERLVSAQTKAKFNPHFRGFFGTNWDKSAIVKDSGAGTVSAISSGCFTAIVAPDGTLLNPFAQVKALVRSAEVV